MACMRTKFKTDLQALQEGPARKGGTQRYALILERVGRLKERYPYVAGQYAVTVQKAAVPPPGPAATGPGGGADLGMHGRPCERGRAGGHVRAADESHGRGSGAHGAHILAVDRGGSDLPQPKERDGAAADLAHEAATDSGAPVPGSAGVPSGATPADPPGPGGADGELGQHPASADQSGATHAYGAGAEWRVDHLPEGRPPRWGGGGVGAGIEPGPHRVRTRLATPTASGGANPQIR